MGSSIGHRIAWLLAIIVLLGTGAIGVSNGISEWPDARTGAQHAVTAGVFLYGLLGLAAGVGLALRRRWSYGVAGAWGAVVTCVAGGAVAAYGGVDASIGAVIAASLGTAVVAAGVVWATKLATRSRVFPARIP